MTFPELNTRQKIGWSLLVLFLIALGYRCVEKTLDGNDLFIQKAGMAVWQGERIYPAGPDSPHVPGPDHFYFDEKQSRQYLYSPFSALLGTPFYVLHDGVFAGLYYCFKLYLIYLMCVFTRRMLRNFDMPVPGFLALFPAFVLIFRFFDNDFQNGQINVVVTFLVVASIYAVANKQVFRGGLWIALALTIKQPPLLFAAHFVWKRQWRYLGGVVIGTVAFLYVIPGLFIGFPEIHAQNQQWFGSIFYSASGESLAQDTKGAAAAKMESYVGLLSKFLVKADAAPQLDGDQYVNIMNLSPRVVSALSYGVGLLSLGVLGLLTLRKNMTAREENWRWLVELGIIALLTVLISPVSRRAHFAIVFLPLILVAYTYFQCGRREVLLTVCLVVMAVFWVLRTKISTAYGGVTWGGIALFVALIRLHFLTDSAFEKSAAVPTAESVPDS
jgi:hypothetical protein